MRSLALLGAAGILGLVFVVACSSNDATPGSDAGADAADGGGGPDGSTVGVDYRSGTRLKAEVWTSTDGAKVFHGFYDTQLETECLVQVAEDGAFRCLPKTDGQLYFTDAKCTQALANASGDCNIPFVGQVVGECGTAIYPRGAKTTGSNLFTLNGAKCEAFNGDPGTLYQVGTKIDPSSFVKATIQREARGSELMMEHWDMDDGARMPIGPWDVGRKGKCASSADFGEKGGGHCVPSRVAYAEGQFSDATCTTRAALVTDIACNYPADDVRSAAWVYGQTGNCAQDHLTGFANVGSTISTTAYQKSGNTCQAAPFTAKFVPVGTDLPLTSLPKLTLGAVGAGRIQRWVERSGTGEELMTERFYDQTLGAPCEAKPAADGKLRCIPVGDTTFWYADAACTQPVFADASTAQNCPVTVPAWMVGNVPGAACTAAKYQSFKVGAKIASQATVYSFNGTTCQANTGSDSWVLYGTTEQAASSLAELGDVQE